MTRIIRWPLWALGMVVGVLVRAWRAVLWLLLIVFLLAVIGAAWLLIEATGVPA